MTLIIVFILWAILHYYENKQFDLYEEIMQALEESEWSKYMI